MQRGNLTRLDGGRWRVRLGAGRSHDGRYRTLTRTFRAATPAEARRIASAVIAEWDAEMATEARVKGTLAELIDAYVAHRAAKDSPSTIYRRQAIIAQIRVDLGAVPLARLTARQIDAWTDTLVKPPRKGQRGRSPATAHHYYRTLRAILQQAYRWGMLDANPSDRATPPSVRRPDTAARMPQVADVQAMLPLATPSVRVAILLAVATGMRRGEMMALRWSSVDLDVGVVAVRQAAVKVPGAKAVVRAPKSEAGQRTVTLPPSMVDALRAHLARRNEWITTNTTRRPPDDGPVLAHLRADPSGRTAYSPDWLSQEWERLRDRIGRPQLQWKGLRALHASLLAEAQVSPAALAQRQGHAQVSTTLNYYTMEIAGADRAAAQALEVVMGRLGPGEEM